MDKVPQTPEEIVAYINQQGRIKVPMPTATALATIMRQKSLSVDPSLKAYTATENLEEETSTFSQTY